MKTMELPNGKRMLDAEPIDFCGFKTFDDLSVTSRWLKQCHRNIIEPVSCDDLVLDQDDLWGMSNMLELIDRIDAYRMRYLVERVHALEEYCGLHENQDIDGFTVDCEEGGDE